MQDKIRRGQAVNLSIQDAIHHGKENDKTYILKRFIYYYEFAELLQHVDMEELKTKVGKMK